MPDGSATLTERLRITAAGLISIQNDSGKFTVGGDDLQMYHDGTHSRIVDNRDSGTLRLQNFDGFKVIDKDAGETMISAVVDGAVELYYDNSKKLETTSGGLTVTGNILPEANNTRDLGGSGTAFANVHATILLVLLTGNSSTALKQLTLQLLLITARTRLFIQYLLTVQQELRVPRLIRV